MGKKHREVTHISTNFKMFLKIEGFLKCIYCILCFFLQKLSVPFIQKPKSFCLFILRCQWQHWVRLRQVIDTAEYDSVSLTLPSMTQWCHCSFRVCGWHSSVLWHRRVRQVLRHSPGCSKKGKLKFEKKNMGHGEHSYSTLKYKKYFTMVTIIVSPQHGSHIWEWFNMSIRGPAHIAGVSLAKQLRG